MSVFSFFFFLDKSFFRFFWGPLASCIIFGCFFGLCPFVSYLSKKKKLKIPFFQGKNDPEAYLEWERKVELVFDKLDKLEFFFG